MYRDTCYFILDCLVLWLLLLFDICIHSVNINVHCVAVCSKVLIFMLHHYLHQYTCTFHNTSVFVGASHFEWDLLY